MKSINIKQAEGSFDRWRARLEELGVRWHLPDVSGDSYESVATKLRERVKELNCLYAISQLSEQESMTVDEFLGRVVDVLPPSWQYPNIACAEIVMRGTVYESRYYQTSRHQLSAPIVLKSGIVGEVTVFYNEDRPEENEGPFLREERILINTAAEMIGHGVTRKIAEERLETTNRQLMVKQTALREANSALQAVLYRIEKEKSEIQKAILENVRIVLIPIIHELAIAVPQEQKVFVDLLEENLEQITSPFVRTLSSRYHTLTTTEIRICNMIRSGLGSKEIASLRGVTAATISRHRESIRKKLGITNQKVNLTTYLQHTMDSTGQAEADHTWRSIKT